MITDFRKRIILEKILFNRDHLVQRYTQDSPIYPEVWIKYFFKSEDDEERNVSLEDKRVDLLLNINRDHQSYEFLKHLRECKLTKKIDLSKWAIANSGDTLAVKITFEELIHVLLPMTPWYQKYVVKKEDKEAIEWLEKVICAINYSWQITIPDNRDDANKLFDNNRYMQFVKPPKLHKSEEEGFVWSISWNRPVRLALYKSIPSIKGDATRRLFDVDGRKIKWAVIDSGIDARHQSFHHFKKYASDLKDKTINRRTKGIGNPAYSRIVETYDFTKFRDLFAILEDSISDKKLDIFGKSYSRSALAKKIFQNTSFDGKRRIDEVEMNAAISDLKNAIINGRVIDWSILKPFIQIPHDKEYDVPGHKHGTHVAGIIGANSKYDEYKLNDKITGVCPAIEIIDIRALDDEGRGDEFSILAAIQFIRWMNRQKDQLAIHGVNISLSLDHDVSNYACGRTPICEECERLISEGTIVVAAAGNNGQALYLTEDNQKMEGFRTISITDPGNAENVITVGATHRNKPHTYGVSYFSSRGPTGDGRIKPDLVAPGEKVMSTTLDDTFERMDGTSMAAPHVSGAIALLLDKNRELIGSPIKVKDILCQSATDLKREKYFQGCGMIDILRAMQSI